MWMAEACWLCRSRYKWARDGQHGWCLWLRCGREYLCDRRAQVLGLACLVKVLADALRHCTLPLSCTAGGCCNGACGARYVAHGAAPGAAGGCCCLWFGRACTHCLHAFMHI